MKNHLPLSLILVLFLALPASAHKVTIFAWVEGATVHTQSKFSGGKKAVGAEVVVLDPGGRELLSGRTDGNGLFSFKVPQKTDLKVVLRASMGHLAEWVIPAAELGSAPPPTAPAKGAAREPGAPSPTVAAASAPPLSPSPSPVIGAEDIERIVDASLDRKLEPIARMLAESRESSPGLTEILGGIGYIFGLAGVALYFSSRKASR